MKNTLETRLGMFVALVVVAAFFITFIVGGFEMLKPGYRLYALFNTAQELKEGDRVKMAGVEVGKADKIELADSKVKVTVKMRGGVTVRTDSTAKIKFAGLMGQNFVALDFGKPGSPVLTDGQYLSTAE